MRNPYYGAGLAVHADLLVCESCGYTGYADNPEDDAAEAAGSRAEGPLRRFLRMIVGG
ncbi:hypothetical protein [Leifsonia sp. NPDC077715]|uniref:hypothetical protein n=1 Tax=Leifsonia sp. NPDC077715 TaxID=3155539 RepID=UPI0034304223